MNRLQILGITPRARLAATLRKLESDVEDTVVDVAAGLDEACRLLEGTVFDLVVLDLAIDPDRSIDFLIGLRHAIPGVSVLVVTDKLLRDYDRDAIKLGIDGFLVQPVRSEHVYFQVSRVREIRRLQTECSALREMALATEQGEGIVGTSAEVRRVIHQLSEIAPSIVPVALYGETGTGKELVARVIHRLSPRKEGPFVAINPSSIPETLLESELFGHARGAFTGARHERAGYVESAAAGTLFLDEIGDLPMAMQGKLLRVLQERTLFRVGSSKPVRVDFRLITATHRDLLGEVRAGRFRQDLFYRIHVFPVYLPPLRNRRGDIPLLAEHFLRRFGRETGKAPLGFDAGAVEALMNHSWPGNVRELENVIHRIVATKRSDSVIHRGDLAGLVEPLSAGPTAAPADGQGRFATGIRPLRQVVRDYVQWVLERADRNKARAAKLLEIERATLYRKL